MYNGKVHVSPAPRRGIEQLLEAEAYGLSGPVRIFRTHVGVAHQHDGLLALLPSVHFQAVLVVEIVRTFTLRNVAPGPGHVARRIGVFQEMKRECFVGQHRARQSRALDGSKRFVGEPRGFLERA